MKALADYFLREKFVAVMLGVIAIVLIASHFQSQAAVPVDAQQAPNIYSEESRIETTQQIREWGENIEKKYAAELSQNPWVALGGMGVMFIFMLGIFIDMRFLSRWKSHRPTLAPSEGATSNQWKVSEVFKIFVILFFVEILLSLFLGFLTGFFPSMRSNSNILLILATFIRSLVVYVFLLHLLKKRYGSTLADLGLRKQGLGANIVKGLMAYLALIPVYIAMILVLAFVVKLFNYQAPVQTPVQMLYKESNQQFLIVFAIFIGLIGPFFEEVLFRGFMYQVFRKRWGILRGLFFSTLIFSLMHAHLVAAIPILVLGIALCLAFEYTGSLIPGIVMHTTHNGIMLGITFAIRGVMQ